MSERLPGIEPARPPEPRKSALAMVVRRGTAGRWEVLLGLRSRRSGFFPSNWAFPGGRLEEEDGEGEAGYARCASRELAEETGLEIPPERLAPVGFKRTPPFHPRRYDTLFFLAELPAGQALPDTPPIPEETEALRFFDPRAILAEWQAGRALLPPPLPPLLRAMEDPRADTLEGLLAVLREANEIAERVHRIEFVPGAWLLPVRSETLPPATHTNCWLAGGRRFVIVDPGSPDREENDRLLAVIERRRREEGDEPVAVVLTHHHRDHVDGAPAVARALDLPIRAHPATVPLLPFGDDSRVRGDLVEGLVLDLGGVSLEVIETPGHAPGHVVLRCPERRYTLAGDLVSGFGSVYVGPRRGDMGAYMDSLRRLAARDPGLLHPGHGPPLPPRALAAALAHREEREAKILALLSAGPRTLGEIAGAAWDDRPHAPERLRRDQALSHLLDLERRGRVHRAGEETEGPWFPGPGAPRPRPPGA